jgi:hypothetical protein
MIFTTLLGSQTSKPYTHNSLAEKIYLQLDNEVYTSNKTISFKAIVLNAASHNADYSSGILYVDLINSESQIIESKLVKIKEGIGNGYFDLDRNFEDGVYLIRAYTEWNKNFDSDFVFEKYVQIHSESGKETFKNGIHNIRVIDSSQNLYTIAADVFPSLIDKNLEDALTMIISENGKQDTIALNANKEGKYTLEYQIPKITKRIELEVETKSKSKYKTLFSPNKDYLDLQFFPEGGKLLQGISSKIGFKAIGEDGKAMEVEGEILDNLNQVVTTFKSNVLGMGSFILENPESSKHYSATLKSNSNLKGTKLALPKVHGSGFALAVTEKEDRIFVKVAYTHEKTDSVILKGICRGYTYSNSEATLING